MQHSKLLHWLTELQYKIIVVHIQTVIDACRLLASHLSYQVKKNDVGYQFEVTSRYDLWWMHNNISQQQPTNFCQALPNTLNPQKFLKVPADPDIKKG